MEWSSVLTGGLREAFERFVVLSLSEAAQAAMPGGVVKVHPDSNDAEELALVLIPAGGEVKPHLHRVSATMIIVHGDAVAVGGDHDGKRVGPGTPIRFEAGHPHGFREAGPAGFAFYSVNGGIRGQDFVAA